MIRDDNEGLIYLADTINGIVNRTFWFRLIAFVAYLALMFGLIWWTMPPARGEENTTIVPKTVRPIIEKGLVPSTQPWLGRSFSPGEPIQQYNFWYGNPKLKLVPPFDPAKPQYQIQRCKWPCERSA